MDMVVSMLRAILGFLHAVYDVFFRQRDPTFPVLPLLYVFAALCFSLVAFPVLIMIPCAFYKRKRFLDDLSSVCSCGHIHLGYHEVYCSDKQRTVTTRTCSLCNHLAHQKGMCHYSTPESTVSVANTQRFRTETKRVRVGTYRRVLQQF